MSQDQFQGVLRHLLTFLGGFLTAKLVKWGVSPELLEAVIGALVTLGGIAWSVANKKPAVPVGSSPPEAK